MRYPFEPRSNRGIDVNLLIVHALRFLPVQHPHLGKMAKKDLKASVNYLKRDSLYDVEKPYTIYVDISKVPGAKGTNILTTPVSVEVKDVRGLQDKPSLEKNGFELIELEDFPFDCFEDEDWIRQTYYPSISQFLVAKLGARQVHVFEHQVRTPYRGHGHRLTCDVQLRYRHPGFMDKRFRPQGIYDAPVPNVHAGRQQRICLSTPADCEANHRPDQTPQSARARFRRHWPDFDESLHNRRLQTIK